MCTVTFIARRKGYALGMNRDEQLTRIPALPPGRRKIGDRMALFPSEPGGGTWIGVNDAGITFALINWYSVKPRVSENPVSRGQVVRAALAGRLPGFESLPLNRINPFRLIGIFPDDQNLIEWRWNLSRLEKVDHQWETRPWISSGFDEPGAEITRRRSFQSAMREKGRETIEWLRALHGSHTAGPGPYSICMHREDAATVSYTEIEVEHSNARLSYSAGSPCCPARPVFQETLAF